MYGNYNFCVNIVWLNVNICLLEKYYLGYQKKKNIMYALMLTDYKQYATMTNTILINKLKFK